MTESFQFFVRKDGVSKNQNHTSALHEKIARRHPCPRQNQIAIDFYIDIDNGKKFFLCFQGISYQWLKFQTLWKVRALASNEATVDGRRFETGFSCLQCC